ncbi:MAG TPA: hypothetical protein VF881_00625 [Polyangiaceae bacterium]
MKHHFMSRKHFLSVSVLGGLGVLGFDCTLPDEDEPSEGGLGNGGTSSSTTGTPTGSGGTSTGSTTTGNAGSGGTSTTGGGNGGSGSSTGGTGGTGGSGGGAGSGGSKDAGTDSSIRDAGALCSTNVNANISINHDGHLHALIIPEADIRTGTTKVYPTTSASTDSTMAQQHTHYVQVTAADFTALKAGMTVKKYSCNLGDHEYVLKCGGTTDMGGAPNCGDAANTCGGSNTNFCK